MTILEVNKLEKTFVQGFFRKRTRAVDGVSFKVQAGEVFGFLGPNGAGKTTVMKMLMGLIHPTGGTATVLGSPAGDVKGKRRVGYLPEKPYFYDYLSALEFMHMVGRLFGLSRAERDKRAHALLDRVGLSMAKTRSMRSYSKGMMQRVGLAQALIGDPELVVMDEPMSGLDPIGRKEVRDLITSLRDEGKTVFFCTHILADASMLCDRVSIIVKGKIKDEGRLEDLLGNQVQSIEVQWSDTAGNTQMSKLDDQEAADALLAKVISSGGRVLEMRPHTMTLEELFVRDAGTKAEDMRS